MPKGKRRVFSREFKLSAVKRMVAGESAAALSRELQVPSGHLYKWCIHFRSGGAEALRAACRPRKGFGTLDLEPTKDLATARKRISELEEKDTKNDERVQKLYGRIKSNEERDQKTRETLQAIINEIEASPVDIDEISEDELAEA